MGHFTNKNHLTSRLLENFTDGPLNQSKGRVSYERVAQREALIRQQVLDYSQLLLHRSQREIMVSEFCVLFYFLWFSIFLSILTYYFQNRGVFKCVFKIVGKLILQTYPFGYLRRPFSMCQSSLGNITLFEDSGLVAYLSKNCGNRNKMLLCNNTFGRSHYHKKSH